MGKPTGQVQHWTALDDVHSDLWGAAKVESFGGARYFLSLVDDYSRRVWVYILKIKMMPLTT